MTVIRGRGQTQTENIGLITRGDDQLTVAAEREHYPLTSPCTSADVKLSTGCGHEQFYEDVDIAPCQTGSTCHRDALVGRQVGEARQPKARLQENYSTIHFDTTIVENEIYGMHM